MSLVSGLLVGYVAMKTLRKHQTGTEHSIYNNVLDVRHSIPGRLRLGSKQLTSEPMANALMVQLTKIDSIQQVSVNTVTGSILIIYEADKVDDQLLIGAVVKLLGLEEDLLHKKESIIKQEIKLVGSSINNSIYDKTHGILDGKTAVSMSFLGLAIYNIVTAKKMTTPPTLNLLYWTYNSLQK